MSLNFLSMLVFNGWASMGIDPPNVRRLKFEIVPKELFVSIVYQLEIRKLNSDC